MSRKSNLALTLTLCFCFFFKISPATHIVGGEMSYRCLGGNDFEVTMTVYRDCINGVPYFDSPASIGVFDMSDSLVADLRPHVQADDTLGLYNYFCVESIDYACIHAATYKDTVNLAPMAGGYNFAYQRCCRNGTITNIEIPDSTGATYMIYISEAAILDCNSSPVYASYPPSSICAAAYLNFDHSAIDPEGDSIVYELCAPLNGAQSSGNYTCTPQPCGVRPQPPFNPPFAPITWRPPFSTQNMTNFTLSTPAISIDPVSGELTGLPLSIGQYAIGICMKEYRNGVLYSSSNRDFQYNIMNCTSQGNPSVNFTASYDTMQPLLVYFMNNSTSTSTDTIVGYEWDFGDGNFSTDINPTHLFVEDSTFTVDSVVVKLTATTFSGCEYTFAYYMDFLVPPFAAFKTTNTGNLYQFENNSHYSRQYLWDFGDGSTSTEENPTHLYTGKKIDHTVSLVAYNLHSNDTTSMTVTVTGIKTPDWSQQIELFPNPSDDGLLSLQVKGIKLDLVEVYQLDGRKVHSQIPSAGTQVLDLSGQAMGVYLVKFTRGNKSYSVKVLLY